MHLREAIEQIGSAMVACASPCSGIDRDQPRGSLPRCLVLEERDPEQGCAIIGINPGRASEEERRYYRDHRSTYTAVVRFWTERVGYRHPYYTRLRRFVDLTMPGATILWTELAKCENALGTAGLPPLQTLRTCSGAYLRPEIMLLPENWPVMAIGAEAFKACAYMFSDRAVIGVPHPTGSRGHFAKLFDHDAPARLMATTADAINRRSAVWLG